MNRIKSLKERLKFAKIKIKELELLIPLGYPFSEITLAEAKRTVEKIEVVNDLLNTNIVEAIRIAEKLKNGKSIKTKTNTTNSSRARLFINYLEKNGLKEKRISDFSERDARKYLNNLEVNKTLRPRTFNNYLSQTKAFFELLKENEYIETNPFDRFKLKKKVTKLRRAFSPEERVIIAKYLYENNRRLYYAVLLQYYGFIRPGALRDMKFSWIRVNEGVIQVPPGDNKSDRWKFVTIPDLIKKEIFNKDFMSAPAGYYVFGHKLQPHRSRRCGENTFNYHHRLALLALQEKGLLNDISGFSFYSWKDTGLTEHGEYISLLALQQQAGHSDPKVTLKYIHQRRVNKSMKEIKRSVFDE